MTYTPIGHPAVDRPEVSRAAFGYIVVDNLTDLDARVTTNASGKADKTTTVAAGTGLTGGGDLSANRTLTVAYGTAAGTATQGNDTRVVNAVQPARQILAGTGLTGGGDLSADRTLTVAYGNTSTTAASGDRVTNLEGPSCVALLTTSQSAVSGSNVTVNWQSTEQNDSVAGSPMWAVGSPDQIVIRKTGRYLISASAMWDPLSAAVSGQRLIYILKNATAPVATGVGSVAYNFFLASGTSPGGGVGVSVGATRRFTAGDILRVVTFHSQGSTVNLVGNVWGGNMVFSASYVGA